MISLRSIATLSVMESKRPADFLCQQTDLHHFSISPCTYTGVVWLHKHALPHEATYDGKPITLDLPGILNLIEKISTAGFEIVSLNADLIKLERGTRSGDHG